ncbi:MAG: NAD-dependent deacetylase, partial [Sulfurovaceae bacterium]|nr:NAD-dependent deacetylase [Sulfurovaceae bacterium]
MKNKIQKAREKIAEADVILITAGAGMGVDSGLPDFRGDEGFWKAYPVIKDLGHSFVDMANPQWFETNPKLAWAFYGHRLNLYRETLPHEGFYLLKELVESKKDYFIFTSNVDGQFQKAGFPEDKIEECHGSIHHFQCVACGQGIYSAKDETIDVDMIKFEALNIPKCPKCNEIVRPNILMFG